MKKTKFSTYFVFISFFTLVTILVVIIQKSYSNLIDPINKVSSPSLGRVINPELDLEIIEEIALKPVNFNEDSLSTNSIEESTNSSEQP